MKLMQRFYLPVTVFITGGCILVLEIVATRILSPYFGNTIYTVSSVLSIVLAALSFGYYYGGKLADVHPTNRLFYSIIFAGGLGVMALQGLQEILLPMLGSKLSAATGPLAAAMLLFFVPSFILGLLSPFAIKLADMRGRRQGIGSIAGKMFFFSTMGSIFGSLAAGYLLIPNLAVSTIILGTGVVLLCLGAVPLVLLGLSRRRIITFGLLIVTAAAIGALEAPQVQAVYSRNGIYEKITIVDSAENGRPVRFLFQDRSRSGGMYLDADAQPYSGYTKYYRLPDVFSPKLERAAVLGGGMYAMPRALIADYPHVVVDTVEIEPSLVPLSERYFGLPKDPRLVHHIADGRRFLVDTPNEYDLIFSDVYFSLYSIPMHFTTKEFFQTAYKKLNDGGIFMANIIDTIEDREHSILRAEIQTMRQVFPQVYVFAVKGPAYRGVQNFMVVGHKSRAPIRLDHPVWQASNHETIRNLAKNSVGISPKELARHPVLTDDYAPVESWSAGLVRSRQR